MGFLTMDMADRMSELLVEDPPMPAIVDFPTVVKEALAQFGSLFANEPEREHFAEYLTGLLVAGKKNISGINRQFAVTTDQSCLNCWITTDGFWDGKQHLGMGGCQLTDGLGQTRHMYLVFLAHSVLMRQLRQGRASAWARERLTTLGQACLAVLKETLSDTISWVVDRTNEGWKCERIKAQLALP